jgi:hypothetical protein
MNGRAKLPLCPFFTTSTEFPWTKMEGSLSMLVDEVRTERQIRPTSEIKKRAVAGSL